MRVYRSFYYRLRLKEIMGESYLYRAIRRILVRELGVVGSRLLVTGDADYDSISLDDLHCRVSPDRYREMLAEFIEFFRERGLPVILVPIRHRAADRYFFQTADDLARGGRYEEAILVLRGVERRDAVYGIVVVHKINELLRALGREDEMAESVDVRLKWMNTDGNIPVYLSDLYVEIMLEAAKREGVYAVELIDRRSFDQPELYIDHIHLNQDGHRLLAEKLYAALAEIGELPTGTGTRRPAAAR
jgi:lysophospholipase L1-like esterase